MKSLKTHIISQINDLVMFFNADYFKQNELFK